VTFVCFTGVSTVKEMSQHHPPPPHHHHQQQQQQGSSSDEISISVKNNRAPASAVCS
jgi:hypothetical protein